MANACSRLEKYAHPDPIAKGTLPYLVARSKPLTHVLFAITVWAILLVAGSARAEEPTSEPTSEPTPETAPPSPPPTRPWAENVPDSAQREALALFEEGNKLFETSQHAAALAKYREALKVWDHPAIRYNAAVALINLDQPLAANENLELALRYGALPFSPDTYQQALIYQKLLHGQLARLKVSCGEPDAEVTMDGAPLFISPGETTQWLLPGPHQIVVRKAGYLTETRSLTLVAGRQASEAVALQQLRTIPTHTVQRWPTWQPWAVLGSGLVVGALGVPFMVSAKSNINAYDDWISASCPTGCETGDVPRGVFDQRDRGRTQNIVAVSLFSAGGALAAGGIVMLILNQPRSVPLQTTSRLSATPVIGAGTVGVSVAFEH
ncbi:MAG TPA: hypothetical protein VFK05_36280 [Polyangiaceae bacterium]|nr:hypothetical protein [Polyangiaceae bacterium]